MRYDPAEYLYASARIRALEARFAVEREKLIHLCELDTADEILRALSEHGFQPEQGELAPDLWLEQVYQTVEETVPSAALVRFMRYPTDCHNLKTVLKCRVKGIDPTPMLIDTGSISAQRMQECYGAELAALLPPHLARALPIAEERYAKSGDPREIDFALDRALYEDMASEAALPFAAEWLAAKADLANLLLCLRLLRMQSGELGRSTLCRAYLPIGSFDEAWLLQCYDGGEAEMEKLLFSTPYRGIFEKNTALFAAELAADAYLMRFVKTADDVLYGAEVPLAYLLRAEAICKDVRILLSGKRAGLSPDKIKERMRVCYV